MGVNGQKRTVAPERFDPAGATVTSCHYPTRGGVHLAHSVGAGPEGVKRMTKETVRLGPIRVPGEVAAAKIEYAWQISEERPATLVKCENVGGPLHKLVFRKTILRGGMVLGPFIDEVWGRSTVEVATVIVDGDYIEVAQVRDGGAPIVAWLVDLVHDLWLDDAPAAQDDQAPADVASGREETPAPAATYPVPKRKDVIDRVRQAHELLKNPSNTPSTVFRDLARIDKDTYRKYCRGVTGEYPVEL